MRNDSRDKTKVYIRADASNQIGFGHFIRSLALVEMLKDEFDCTFFTQEPNDFQKKEIRKVCKLTELHADDTKFNDFLNCLTGNEIVVLDNYFYTSDYEKAIKEKGCELVSIGTNDRHYYADAVVNFTKLQPSDFSAESYTKFCLGLEWTILRKPFYVQRNVEKKDFVICVGGTDQFAYSERFYDILNSHYPQELISIIATDMIGQQRINAFKAKGVNLQLNITAEQMALQFAQAKIAIVSASSVAVEALSQGANVVAGHYVDNQLNIYRALQEDEYIWGVGSFADTNVTNNIHEAVTAIERGEMKKIFEANNTVFRYRELFNSL